MERALSVLDGAVLVISAVEGVQPQTRILMRALQRLGVPAVVFVNKIDHRGAGDDRLLRDISDRLTPAIVAMSRVRELGTRAAHVTPRGDGDADFTARLAEVLAEQSEPIMAAYVNAIPTRPRLGLNPLNREEYLRLVTRRTTLPVRYMAEVVRLTREVGEFGTLLAIDRARQVLGFEPRHSWRDHVSA